jgi:broad specificity phosphatase PhoE/predicted kinase
MILSVKGQRVSSGAESGPKLYIVMVGLPARGKSTIATKLKENLVHNSVRPGFSTMKLRRKMITKTPPFLISLPQKQGGPHREENRLTNMQAAKRFINKDGQVAILDATNVTSERRGRIRALLNDHPMLFIECINDDEDILSASILRKIDLHEFGHLTQEEAIQSFRQRISYYQSMYAPLDKEGSFIRLDSLNNRILDEELGSDIPFHDQIRDFLVTDTVKNLYLIRHGETYFNLENRIGGDSPLTPKGAEQAQALAKYFKNKKIPLIFTSKCMRTIQTAEPIKALQKESTIIPLREFNEIDSGICECLSYEEIRTTRPHVYSERKKDKYNYVYPGGEGYVTMQERIHRGIKKALYLSNPSDYIMIIGHRAVNRMILSHFLFRRTEDVPYIYIPQDKFYHISATQSRKSFQLRSFK